MGAHHFVAHKSTGVISLTLTYALAGFARRPLMELALTVGDAPKYTDILIDSCHTFETTPRITTFLVPFTLRIKLTIRQVAAILR